MTRAERSSHAESLRRRLAEGTPKQGHVAPWEDPLDQMYEDAMKACYREGHAALDIHITDDGREGFTCIRCKARFEEVL